jgi:twitching motility protein PilT
MDITKLLEFAVQQEASDVHISAGESPILRIHGSLKRVKLPPLSEEDSRALIYDIMNDEQRKTFEERQDIDFSIEVMAQYSEKFPPKYWELMN